MWKNTRRKLQVTREVTGNWRKSEYEIWTTKRRVENGVDGVHRESDGRKKRVGANTFVGFSTVYTHFHLGYYTDFIPVLLG